jgi:hypothetical protein
MSTTYEQHQEVTSRIMDLLETLEPLIDSWFKGAFHLSLQPEEVYDIQSDFQDLGRRMWRVALKSCRACQEHIARKV